MARINMTVVLDEAYIDRATDVCHSLQTIGMHVDQLLPEVGIISGAGDDELLKSIRVMEGVEEARQEHTFQLPPLSEKVPQ